jgi:hypothetical protein
MAELLAWRPGRLPNQPLVDRVRIQKPIVTCDKKAVCPDLFATLPNVFDDEILILFANNC